MNTKLISKKIADEAWRMLPDDCKLIMNNLEHSYKESLRADIEHEITERINERSFIRSCCEGYQDVKINGKKVENLHALINTIQMREFFEAK